MRWALFFFDVACKWLILALLHLATGAEAIRQRVPNVVGKRGGEPSRGAPHVAPSRRPRTRSTHSSASRSRHARIRSTPDIEAKVTALKNAQPQLGAGRLRYLLQRIHGHTLARETIRLILRRQPAPVRAHVASRSARRGCSGAPT